MHSHVKPALRQLEALDKVTYGKLEETLYKVMEKSLGKTAAKIGSQAITEVIRIFGPIKKKKGGQ